MLGGSAGESELEGRVRAVRKLVLDGSEAIYDLRFGVDFSKPRRTAEAIARVVWQEDVQAWWTVNNGKPVCTPTHRVKLLVPDEHNRRIGKTLDEFTKDLREQDLGERVAGYLDSRANREADWGAIILMGPLWAYLLQDADIRAQRREDLESLFSQMAKYITVAPQ